MTCEQCIKMNAKKDKLPDCSKCQLGFVEIDPENYRTVGLIEKYGINTFLDGMSGNVNTTAIKNILEVEEITGQDYKDEFHNLVIFLSAATIASKENKPVNQEDKK